MNRAVTPAIAVPLLVGITVLLAVVLGVTTLGTVTPPSSPGLVVISASATADGRIELVHEAGPEIDVRRVDLLIAIDGEPLAEQPPIPFFSASGFRAGPTGPFNSATDPHWTAGERTSLRIAGTNDPDVRQGATITVRIVRDDLPIAVTETRVEP